MSLQFANVSANTLLAPGDGGAGEGEPSTVVVFGWMNAARTHVAKYCERYRALFPGAALVLVETTSTLYAQSDAAREKALAALVALLAGRAQSRGIIFHIFSNAGASQFVALSRAAPALCAHAVLVLDSAPGIASLRTVLAAFAAPLRPAPARWAAAALLAVAWLVLRPRAHREFARLRAALADPALTAFLAPRVPRLYLHGARDAVVPPAAVAAHVAALHVPARVELFDDAAHVGCMRAEPVRYWALIAALWARANDGVV